MKRSGFADLPLHGGRVPAWLADRMTLEHEHAISPGLGGRSVFGAERTGKSGSVPGQMRLFDQEDR